MENLNNTENIYDDIPADADELAELDKLNNDENVPEEIAAIDGAEEAPTGKTNTEPAYVTVVGVRFKNTGKVYYFDPKDMEFTNGENVVVDTSRGIEYGTVCMPNKAISSSEIVPPIRRVIRKATAEDEARRRKNEELEINAYNTFIERIDAHGLEMKLIDVECAFDNSKLLFYFSAESRIDFRELVRELAGIFHTRIELRQIGIRDEAKMLGGLGICGRPFCCSSFLSDFVQVSIKMAKEQNLSLNSAKISGACGKLMCCLRYEYDSYLAEKALTPKVGAEVMTPDGEGVVSDANPMTGIVKVKLSGTAEDDAPAVFIRDDLVLKENYKGEKLTKTPLPEKRTGAAPQSGFEVRSPFAERIAEDNKAVAPEKETTSDNKGGKDKRNKRDNRSPAKNDRTDNNGDQGDNGGKNAGKDKPRQQGGRPEKNGGRSDKNGKPVKNGDQNRQPKPSAPKSQNAPKPEGGEGGKHEGKHHEGGKKPYKPFYRKNNK